MPFFGPTETTQYTTWALHAVAGHQQRLRFDRSYSHRRRCFAATIVIAAAHPEYFNNANNDANMGPVARSISFGAARLVLLPPSPCLNIASTATEDGPTSHCACSATVARGPERGVGWRAGIRTAKNWRARYALGGQFIRFRQSFILSDQTAEPHNKQHPDSPHPNNP